MQNGDLIKFFWRFPLHSLQEKKKLSMPEKTMEKVEIVLPLFLLLNCDQIAIKYFQFLS